MMGVHRSFIDQTNPARYYQAGPSYKQAQRQRRRESRMFRRAWHGHFNKWDGFNTTVFVILVCVALFLVSLWGTGKERNIQPIVIPTPTTVVQVHLIPPLTITNTNTNTNQEGN